MSEAANLPRVGETVVYFPRPGEYRRRPCFPALVMFVREDEGTIDALVFYDRDDTSQMERIPAVPEDRSAMGWERLNVTQVESPAAETAPLVARLDALEKALFGKLELPEGESVVGILNEYEDRISVIEKNIPDIERALATLKRQAEAKATKKPKAAAAA